MPGYAASTCPRALLFELAWSFNVLLKSLWDVDFNVRLTNGQPVNQGTDPSKVNLTSNYAHYE